MKIKTVTQRQLDIAIELSKGESIKSAARNLGISYIVAVNRLRNAREKFKLQTTYQLVIHLAQLGLLN